MKKYYTGAAAKDVFGAAEAELEGVWRKKLGEYKLRPEVETLLRRKAGEDAKFAALVLDPDKRLPPSVLGKPDDWKTLKPGAKFASGWKKAGDAWEGTSGTNDWNLQVVSAASFKSAIVRARIRPSAGCVGVQLQLGPACQAMLTNAGTFIWKNGVAAQERAETIVGRGEIDLILERREAKVTIWIDGFKVVQGEAGDEAGFVGVGVAGGSAGFENIRVRILK